MKISSLLIDFYGTLVEDDDQIVNDICNEIQNASEIQVSSVEVRKEWCEQFYNLTDKHYGKYFRKQRELSYISLNNTIQLYKSSCLTNDLIQRQYNYLSKPRIFLDSKSFFRDCKLPVYIVSNIDNDNINEAIKFHDIHVSGVLSSEDARSYKPRPELFKKALKEFNLRPEEVVYIGDSLRSDVMGSHKAGLKCIWLNRKNSINLFVKPNYTINNLSILTEVLEG